MTNEQGIEFAKKNGSSMARSVMAQGNYIARKDSDNIRMIGEYEKDKWHECEPNEKVLRFLAFSQVTDMKTGLPVDVSVPYPAFTQLAVKSIFPFKVNEKGYTEVKLQKLTEKQAKQLLSEEV